MKLFCDFILYSYVFFLCCFGDNYIAAPLEELVMNTKKACSVTSRKKLTSGEGERYDEWKLYTRTNQDLPIVFSSYLPTIIHHNSACIGSQQYIDAIIAMDCCLLYWVLAISSKFSPMIEIRKHCMRNEFLGDITNTC